jgi:uncharacterized protein
MKTDTYQHFYRLIETLPVVSSHEHHFPDEFHQGLTLERLFENSYLFTMAESGGKASLSSRDFLKPVRGQKRIFSIPVDDPDKRGEFLEYSRYNSYFVWLQKSLQHIYQIDGDLSSENWDLISCTMAERHANGQVHLEILQKVAGYRRIVLDPFWEYGSHNGHPELFSPTMRTDMFVTSFHPDALDHDGNSPFLCYTNAPTSNFDDYLDFLENLFTGWRNAGAVAMKSASAYDRSLNYEESDRLTAKRVFFREPKEVSLTERKAYEDFMFNWFCELCARLGVPFQVHTGLGKLSGSRPIFLEPVILRHPQIHFVLFHAGYPWYDEMAGLLHNHSNISVDMVWVPLISTTGAALALHEFIEVAQSGDLIGWGGDAFTSEEAFGALLAWRHVVAKVLSEKVDDGYLSLVTAEKQAHKLVYANVAKRYGFQV